MQRNGNYLQPIAGQVLRCTGTLQGNGGNRHTSPIELRRAGGGSRLQPISPRPSKGSVDSGRSTPTHMPGQLDKHEWRPPSLPTTIHPQNGAHRSPESLVHRPKRQVGISAIRAAAEADLAQQSSAGIMRGQPRKGRSGKELAPIDRPGPAAAGQGAHSSLGPKPPRGAAPHNPRAGLRPGAGTRGLTRSSSNGSGGGEAHRPGVPGLVPLSERGAQQSQRQLAEVGRTLLRAASGGSSGFAEARSPMHSARSVGSMAAAGGSQGSEGQGGSHGMSMARNLADANHSLQVEASARAQASGGRTGVRLGDRGRDFGEVWSGGARGQDPMGPMGGGMAGRAASVRAQALAQLEDSEDQRGLGNSGPGNSGVGYRRFGAGTGEQYRRKGSWIQDRAPVGRGRAGAGAGAALGQTGVGSSTSSGMTLDPIISPMKASQGGAVPPGMGIPQATQGRGPGGGSGGRTARAGARLKPLG